MLSSEGNSREPENKLAKRQLCTCSTLFCTFLCRCFARLQLETSRNFQQLLVLRRKCRTCSRSLFFFHCRDDFHLALVAANIFYFLTTATKFLCCSSNNKKGLLCYLSQSRSRSLSPLFWLSFAGLPPTFSFSLSFSCSIFQICGQDN